MSDKKKITLKRIYTQFSTIGVFFYEGSEICFSIELPWKENTRGISCIPEGVYSVAKIKNHPKFGNCFHVTGVPKRSEIMIHAANYTNEIRGCIAPVTNLISFTHGRASKMALAKLYKLFPDEEFNLEILP